MNFGLVLEEGNVVVDQSGYKQSGDFTAQLFVMKAKR
jgi:alpha-galactosidase